MDIIVLFISVDIIASKFLDCYIRYYRSSDTNFKENIFLKILFPKAPESLWLSFFFSVCCVGIALSLLNMLPASFQWLYIIIGMFAITLNLGSAHSNYFGRKNLITQRIRK